MIESKKSGAGDEDLYKPKIWYFDQMYFVLEHNQPRKSIDSMCSSSLSDKSNNHFYDSDGALYTVDVDDNVEVEYQKNLNWIQL
ncbi:hypothetical protein RN001_001018 [Aquatica leii]|uniref:Uncharacterized protein n=1 Tax=Aquatica leii TaxID=1421715 RepID=A0AAN7SJE6_9COLE|nr:hypothetical protein RN001_001018 [Aquatica leii]